jgi:hypothetical protein
MRIPTITGIIRRRILLNYRIDPEIAQQHLPSIFTPKLEQGYAIAGICLIRLEEIRPKGFPSFIGISSENSAHRFAVTWNDENGDQCEGVYVPRRDTDSTLNSLAGGRIFPGVHYHSQFLATQQQQHIHIRVNAQDSGTPLVDLTVEKTESFPAGSIFDSLEYSSGFFEAGSTGYSARPKGNKLDGLFLDVPEWKVSPLEIQKVQSSYFDDRTLFPEGSIICDHALFMENIHHAWHSKPSLTV